MSSGPGIPGRRLQSGRAIPALVFGIPLMAAGAWLMFTSAILPILGWKNSRAWRETPCRMASAEAEWDEGRGVGTLRVRYSYTVETTPYEGTRYDFSNQRFVAEELDEILKAYRAGTASVFYVDPETATESVLSRDYRNTFTGGLVLSGVILLIGVTLAWIGVTRNARNPTAAEMLMSSD